ncbi:MAG: CsbD family protein [Steroidobacteraceae bacterium]
MNKDQVKGAANEAAGKVQKNMGKATSNGTQQVKGAVREVAGKVQKEYGNAKDDGKKADRDIERHTR